MQLGGLEKKTDVCSLPSGFTATSGPHPSQVYDSATLPCVQERHAMHANAQTQKWINIRIFNLFPHLEAEHSY